MWMVTPLGAFSVRCSPADIRNGTLTIESKVRTDLEALAAAVLPTACPIVEVLSKSRGYMIRCGRGEVALALATLAMDLNYDNFVEKFTDQQGSSRTEGHEPLWQAINAQ
jgi:hypothetical protein